MRLLEPAGAGGTYCFNSLLRVALVHALEHALVPKLVPNLELNLKPAFNVIAYRLQVKAKNTSSFPLLASSKVAVFLDGSFVTTTHLKDVR